MLRGIELEGGIEVMRGVFEGARNRARYGKKSSSLNKKFGFLLKVYY